jgi:HSP20 family protein
MVRLIKIRIIRDFDRLEERAHRWMDALFHYGETPSHWRPAADLYETPEGVVLRLEVSGVEPEELSVALAGQELVIKGRRPPCHPEVVRRFLRHEIGHGCFERSFTLPIPVEAGEIRANCQNGILEVYLPRKQPKRIPVTALLEAE